MPETQHVCLPPKPDPHTYQGDEWICEECGRRFWASFAGRDAQGYEVLEWQAFEAEKPSHQYDRWKQKRRE